MRDIRESKKFPGVVCGTVFLGVDAELKLTCQDVFLLAYEELAMGGDADM